MTKPKPVPQGMQSVTPHLICAGAADAIEFYKKAFGATSRRQDHECVCAHQWVFGHAGR
jgi:hypothetical protein